MAAFENLPWLPSSEQFLRAMIAGGEFGVQRGRLQQASMPRGGGGGVSMGGPSAFEAARTAAITGEEKRKQAESEAAGRAWELNKSLASRGATPQQAFDESGIGQFGVKPPENQSDVTPISLGRGGVGVFDRGTGGINILREPAAYPEKTPDEARISTTDTTGMTPAQIAAQTFLNPPRVSGRVGAVNDYLGRTNSPTGPNRATGGGNRKAMGGYKIGTMYNGLYYRGGDLNDKSNWDDGSNLDKM